MTDRRGEPAGQRVLAVYDEALPEVYGYLLDRCGDRHVAEDLTAETFFAIVRDEHRRELGPLSIPWVIGVARHKLADHWRRLARERRTEDAMPDAPDREDPWDVQLERLRAGEVLAALGPHHRSALTLRYVDGLSVPEVAELLDRTVHATEALLVRARAAFRRLYEKGEGDAV